MNAQIASVLKDRLASIDNGGTQPAGLLFIEKLAGLVQTGEKLQKTEIKEAFAVTKFPISLDTNFEECFRTGVYKDLVPDSTKSGILYFESQGTTPRGTSHGSFNYLVRLRLVCWINNKLIQGDNSQSISHLLITQIRTALESKTFNAGPFNRVTVTATNIIDNDLKLFANYTYPAESVKFLMYPYEAFGIDYNIEFGISNACIDELTITRQLC